MPQFIDDVSPVFTTSPFPLSRVENASFFEPECFVVLR